MKSLQRVGFGGQAVNTEFVTKVSRMAPEIFTGFGLTETSGNMFMRDSTQQKNHRDLLKNWEEHRV